MLAARMATVLAGLLLLASPPGAAAAPEDFGALPVHMRHVSIPVGVDLGGPEGVLPSISADVYVPLGSGPWPLVELSHGWPGTLREFPLSGWARRLASRGMVVIVSDRRAASDLAPVPLLDQPADLIDLSSGVNADDILRVLRWAIAQGRAPGSFLFEKVDSRRLAIGGHSLGAYYASFAADKARTDGPRISAVLLLDPSDERLGTHTLDSSLAVAPRINAPTIVLASEENQHPVMCNMDYGTDCTLVAPQEYHALTGTPARLGIKVIGSVHEDVEDPPTQSAPDTPLHLRMFERYAMAWLEYWLRADCAAAGYLGGPGAQADASAGRISILAGGMQAPSCA